MIRNKIIWEYWQNPYGDSDENEFTPEDEADIRTPWEEKESEQKFIKIRPVVPTPMGFMPIHPFQNFSAAFEFWMGHCNFDITQDVKDKIETTAGVEILDIITRYIFRIAVGRAFKGAEVKLEIQRVLNAMPPKRGELNPTDMRLDKTTQEKVSIIQATIKKEFPFWALYVMPNGEIDAAGANSQDDYENHLDLYKGAQELAGGVIFQYA